MLNLRVVRFGVVARDHEFKVGQQFKVDLDFHVPKPVTGCYQANDILEISRVTGRTPETCIDLRPVGSTRTQAVTQINPTLECELTKGFFEGCTYIENTPAAK
ncbi:MAG: hypothetical protein QE263_00895 [Vampirovibrionales bacterium]|nr:hypothetical protein [Vampirovibrionales bacterium]